LILQAGPANIGKEVEKVGWGLALTILSWEGFLISPKPGLGDSRSLPRFEKFHLLARLL
jgi:hypothetical protein